MSEPLELKEQTPYAIDRLDTLKATIMHSIQEMVIHRAKVEKYRKSDLPTARSAYETLEYFRKQLAEQLMESQLFLLETEAYKLASVAGQLRQGVSGFNLMSTGYKPIYEVLSKFTTAFPTGQKTNAAVVGRLMNNIKLGYYPTDPDNISLILRGIRFPDGVTTNLFDPCCGCGKALRQLAQTRLHRVGFGSFFHSRISHEAFHLLFLNPPYLSVINESGGRSRHEKRFLIESLPTLMYGGLLIYVIPYCRLTPDICRILVDNFDALSVWRFTDSEFKKFKQVAVLGIRKHRNMELQDTLWLEQFACSPGTALAGQHFQGRAVQPKGIGTAASQVRQLRADDAPQRAGQRRQTPAPAALHQPDRSDRRLGYDQRSH